MNVLAAAVQMRSGPDKERNLALAERLIREAAAREAAIVVLPEVFNWRGRRVEQAAAAEDLGGDTLSAMARLARELRLFLVAGSITERIPGQTKAYNTSVLLGPDGGVMGVYRKIHLFDVELTGKVSARESDAKVAGGEVICVPAEAATIGLSVCYDLRFPELYRQLAHRGATVVTIPSAFTYLTGEAHWEVLVRARAIENQVFVIAPGQFGPNVHGFSDYGNSMIVDPWGRVLARASSLGEEVIVAPLDFDELERVRRELPSLRHRRLF
ncbi:MAG TPA: carbon-nitrogen hydrolase family protein [Candidatus Binataceae bacterium]|jgi:predicted amidohydrolase|nr:carbon-nitrogen hydrolase family protein [Candidatus Binataceae bacterium]